MIIGLSMWCRRLCCTCLGWGWLLLCLGSVVGGLNLLVFPLGIICMCGFLAPSTLIGCIPCNWHLPWQVAQIQVLQCIWHHIDKWVVFDETSSNTLTLYCFSCHWVKLTPRLCWLLQQWNYCCVIALDGLACAEFTGIQRTQGRIEFNQKECLSLSWSPPSDTMFYLWVVVYSLYIPTKIGQLILVKYIIISCYSFKF